MEDKKLRERAEEVIGHVTSYVVAHISVIMDIESEEIGPDSSLLELVNHDKDKALLILLMLEKKFGIEAPIERNAFIEKFQILEELCDFFICSILEKEGLAD